MELPVPIPYSPADLQALMFYVSHFNTKVETVDGPGILRNFHYSSTAKEINGLEVDIRHADYGNAIILTTYNFGQVNLPGPYLIAPVLTERDVDGHSIEDKFPGKRIQ